MRRLLSLVLVAGAVACDDSRDAGSLTAPPIPTSGTVAYLTVSDPNAVVGSTVTVTATAHQAAGLSQVGAFSAALAYDASGLTFVGEQALPGGMRAVNARDGRVFAAGASSEGFAQGQLFAVTFTVVNPAALASLALTVSELNGTDFGNRLQALDIRTQLYSSRQ